jgi:hypothetical protein
MSKLGPKDIVRMLVALIMAIGGAQGLWIFSGSIPRALGTPLTFYLAFYVLNIVAAVLLWKRSSVAWPLACSLLLLQLFRIDGPTFTYELANCTGVWLMASLEGFALPTNWTSCFKYSRSFGYSQVGPTYYGINIFAAALLAVTWLVRPTHQVEEATFDGDVAPLKMPAS